MATANGTALLQVSEFSLAGVDTTQRKTIVEGSVLLVPAVGSLASIAIHAGSGTGWAVNDEFSIAWCPGAIGQITAESLGVPSAIAIINSGANCTAATAATTTAITSGSTGTALTVTTVLTANAGQVAAITSWSITSNVCTFKAVNSFTTGGSQVLTVQGFTGSSSFLNGTYTTNSATSTTILVPLTHANASGTQQGVAVVQPTYITGGLPISYGFIDLAGLPNPVGTIGPLSVPTWIDVKTIAASAYNYQVNTTVTPNLLRILSGITEVSNTTAITADTVQFRAEFIKNAF